MSDKHRVMVEEMSDSNIEAVVELHIECFKDSFLASLDRDVLTRMYENYVTSELGRAYMYVEDEELVGLVAGVINPSVYYSQMLKKRGVHVLWSVMKRAFREPKILVSMARRDLSGFFRPDESEDAYRKASLDVICVKQEYRGGGIGQQLAEVFLDEGLGLLLWDTVLLRQAIRSLSIQYSEVHALGVGTKFLIRRSFFQRHTKH